MNRRALLSATGALLGSLCGCLAGPGQRSRADSGNSSGATPSPAPDTSSPTATPTDGPASRPDGSGPTRGEADPITTEAVEASENVEYVQAEHAVRYVAAWRHTNQEAVADGAEPEREPVYETIPFEQWARTECVSAAATAAAGHAGDALGTDAVGSGITSTVEGRELAAVVSVETVLDRDGNRVHEAPVAFDALVAATPATVDVTYRFGEQAAQRSVPVYARHAVLQQM